MCSIYGAEASYTFAVKCILENFPWHSIIGVFLITFLILTYTLYLFERQVQTVFYYITTSMWNIVITMTTVGYGDVYAESHAGRSIAVIAAFIGVVIVSLFVLSIDRSFQFDQPQAQAFVLMERLLLKDDLR